MFLTARIFGIFIYILILAFSLFCIRYFPQRQTKWVVWGYLLALCAVAWLYVPDISKDISRLVIYAESYAQSSWNDLFYTLLQSKRGMFTLIYFKIFASHLMSVTALLVFGTVFYIIYDSGQIFKANRTAIALVFLWIMTNDFYVIAITNIRSYLAVAFVSFCIYRETFQHKFSLLNIILYFCAIETHSMGIVLVAFRIFAYLTSGSKITIVKLIFIPLIITGLIAGVSKYAPMLADSTEKFEGYYTYVKYNYIWERVIFSIQTLVQGYILWKSFAYRLFREEIFSSYNMVALGSFIILCICHLHVTFMQRWIIFSAILQIPLLMRLLKQESIKNRHQVKQFLVASCMFTFIFVCSRGNLCSLKFWE